MSHILKHSRLLLVAVCCVALGAGASVIGGAGAATSHPAASAGKAAKTHAPGKDHKRGGLRRFARRAVHGDVVVHTKDGFRTVTFDRGVVDSVSGQQLKLTEGTPKATYKTVTLTIPVTARVRDDRHPSSLSDVKAGQRVLVLSAPKRTIVIARTPHGA